MPIAAQAEVTSITATPFGDLTAFEAQPSDAVQDALQDGETPDPETFNPDVLRFDDVVEITVSDVPVKISVSGDFAFIAKCRLDFEFVYREVLDADGLAQPNAPRNMQAGTIDSGATFHYTYVPGQTKSVSLSHFANSDPRPWAALPEGFLGNATFGDFQIGPNCDTEWPAPRVDDRRPVGNDGLLQDCEVRHSSSMRVLNPQPGLFSGIYGAAGVTSRCLRYSVTARINAPQEPFGIKATAPGTHQCAVVDPESPTLRVAFDDDLDPASIEGNARIREVGAQYTYNVTPSRPETDRIEVAVDSLLPLATSFLLELRTGENGIRSFEGELLGDKDEWLEVIRFHTSPISVNEEITEDFITETGIYQTTRDRPLVRDKWTMGRVWSDWSIEGNEAEGLKDFCVTARAIDFGTEDIIFPEKDAEIKRQDDYTDEDRRMGKQTINLFDWKANPSRVSAQFQVWPQYYYRDGGPLDADPPKAKKSQGLQHLPHDPAHITLYYGQLLLAADGGPDSVPMLPPAIHTENATEFMWQMLPIGKASAQGMGRLQPSDLGLEYAPDILDNLTDNMHAKFLKRLSNAAVSKFGWRYCKGDRDVCILYVPLSETTHESRDELKDAQVSRRIRMSEEMFRVRPEMLNAGHPITHEVAHGFGLAHIPFYSKSSEADELKSRYKAGEPFLFTDFDGIRMARDGQSAHFKHGEYGNSETAFGLFPLMFPILTQDRESMITDTHYAYLENTIYSGGVVGPQEGKSSPESSKPRQAFYRNVDFDHGHDSDSGDAYVVQSLSGSTSDPQIDGHWIGFEVWSFGDAVHLIRTIDPRPGKAAPLSTEVASLFGTVTTDTGAQMPIDHALIDAGMEVLNQADEAPAAAGAFEVFVPGPARQITLTTQDGEPLTYTVAPLAPPQGLSTSGTLETGLMVSWEPQAADLPVSLSRRSQDGGTTLLAIGQDTGSLALAPDTPLDGSDELILALGTAPYVQSAVVPLTVTPTLRITNANASAHADGGIQLDLTFNHDLPNGAVLDYKPSVALMGNVPLFGMPATPDTISLLLFAPPANCDKIALRTVEISGLPADLVIPEQFDVPLDAATQAHCQSMAE